MTRYTNDHNTCLKRVKMATQWSEKLNEQQSKVSDVLQGFLEITLKFHYSREMYNYR